VFVGVKKNMKSSLFRKLISSTMAALILFPAMNNRAAAVYPPPIRFVFVGDSDVGKTSIVHRNLFGMLEKHQRPVSSYFRYGMKYATIEADYFYRIVSKDGNGAELCMWDIPGERCFESLLEILSRNPNVVSGDYFNVGLIVTDLRKDSVEATADWFRECQKTCPDAKMLFVVNNYSPSRYLSDVYDSKEAVESRLKQMHGGDITICHVDPSEQNGCDELLRTLTNLAFESNETSDPASSLGKDAHGAGPSISPIAFESDETSDLAISSISPYVVGGVFFIAALAVVACLRTFFKKPNDNTKERRGKAGKLTKSKNLFNISKQCRFYGKIFKI
jgi:GTPase SAR1 family protein